MLFVMETQTDYRIERWLAIILSLLFFLPFVAKADDVLIGNYDYDGDEMPYRDGEHFLALDGEMLVPVKIGVRQQHDDIADNEGEHTGKRVTVAGFGETWLLVRGKRLHPGKFVLATPEDAELKVGAKVSFRLGKDSYGLTYRCSADACTCALVLAHGGVEQDLVIVRARQYEGSFDLLDVMHHVHLAGDLDHDGRLDLIANLSTHYNETRPTLWLSSAAKPGQLVGKTAELPMTGC
jgi:hypothetical protein